MAARADPSGRVHCGTSGWSYDAWKGPFYPADLPAKRRLAYYGSKLGAVEINNTFYRMPRAEMLEGWAEQVPEEFRFVLKAPRRITHKERLAGDGDSARFFCEVARHLGARLGLLFFQLPPSLRCDLERLSTFLDGLSNPPRIAFEFRHASWSVPEVDALLRERGAGRVIVDRGEGDADPVVATAPFTMLRLRAPAYDDDALHRWSEAIADLAVEEAFVFFKHEDEGVAPRLADRMQSLWDAR